MTFPKSFGKLVTGAATKDVECGTPRATQYHLQQLTCSSHSPTPWKLIGHMCRTIFFPFFFYVHSKET